MKKKKIVQKMIIKKIMNKMNAKKIRKISRLDNEDLRIQTKFEKTRNALRKKSKMIRRIVDTITIRTRIYAIKINEVKIEHIDTIN